MATGLELDASGRIEISDSDFAKLSHLIQTRLGIKMPPAKKPVIQSRLLRRLRILGIATFHDYCQYLFDSDNSQEELSQFLDLATTNKTNFFREPQHFEILTRQVLPSLAERSRRVSVWSAGCSTGEEPYTLAMVLSEFVESRGLTFSVLATDVSGRVLEQAARAVYAEEDIQPVHQNLRRKYLLRSKDRSQQLVRIAPEIRRLVRFERLNFMAPEFRIREPLDIIFCRNVIIYFDRPTQEQLMNKFCRHLKPGGFLFVGLAESLNGLQAPIRFLGKSVYVRE